MTLRDHLQFDLSESQWAALQQHFDILLRWNEQMNLTAIREPEEIAERHFREALALAPFVPAGVRTLVDVGSGGGFPGLPLARYLCSIPTPANRSFSARHRAD